MQTSDKTRRDKTCKISQPVSVPEKPTGRGVHEWPSAFLHCELPVLALGLHGQGLRNCLQQLTVTLGAAVTSLPPLTRFTLMLEPGVVQSHSFLKQPLEVPELSSAHAVEAGVAKLWGDKGLRRWRAATSKTPTASWRKSPMRMTVLKASLLGLQPWKVALVDGSVGPAKTTVQLMVER